MTFPSHIRRHAAAALLTLAAPFSAWSAGDYPRQPLNIVVAFAPGGIADLGARSIADGLAAALGQSVVVSNRGGAGGNIGAATVAKAAPDGYTALVTTTSVVVNPQLENDTGYRLQALTPVINIASSPNVIVAHPALGVGALQELLALAKTRKLSFGSPGSGSTSHLTGDYLFNALSGADIIHAPFRGGGPAIAAAVGGQVDLAIVPVPVAAAQIQAGRLRALAVTGAARSPALPDVPTAAESGFPGYTDYTWVALFLPDGTPQAIAQRLNADVNALLMQPEFQKRLAGHGLEPAGGSLQDTAAFIRAEDRKWADIVQRTGARQNPS
ncbi:tripartite tricarboxylate transporter substrate-binding protein [Pollutimonas bauzanensis]|uniref:Tripartite-type tricarboxylate transporter, receptor component TctC n=1 Tax=Pollutimonas bauzanensis TaxID=658167 RepID=A0A1M5Z5V6_9BURK|nr:tripartite tricarboxylate transporter substrate-binding protein [Pollutimonas bauzanensis]SHI19622.1 Tripartite-type tricarboxylate transporter, receptor component TctC [Pollutimonas bauzanensis]